MHRPRYRIYHPFYIKTVQGDGPSNAYPTTAGSGLDSNGISSFGTVITFTPPASAKGTLYYNCYNHQAMTGIIDVIEDPIFTDGFEAPMM